MSLSSLSFQSQIANLKCPFRKPYYVIELNVVAGPDFLQQPACRERLTP